MFFLLTLQLIKEWLFINFNYIVYEENLLITLIVFSQTISAQNDRKLLKMTDGKSYFELKYDEKGRLIESVEYIADDDLKRSSKYAYSNDKVVQTFYENENIKNKDIRTTFQKK